MDTFTDQKELHSEVVESLLLLYKGLCTAPALNTTNAKLRDNLARTISDHGGASRLAQVRREAQALREERTATQRTAPPAPAYRIPQAPTVLEEKKMTGETSLPESASAVDAEQAQAALPKAKGRPKKNA